MKNQLKKVMRKLKTREAMDKRLAKKGKTQPVKAEDNYDNIYNFCGFEDYDYED